MAKAGKGMGSDGVRGVERVGPLTDDPHQGELGSRRMGNNQLHANDQEDVHNERHRMAGERDDPPETDRFVERHETGLRSDKVAPSAAEIEKATRGS